MISFIEALFLIFTGTVTLSGLTLVGMALRAYKRTSRKEMVHLSIGFGLLVAAAVGTTISAFINNFEHPRTILTVQSFFVTIGFLFLMYSLTIEE